MSVRVEVTETKYGGYGTKTRELEISNCCMTVKVDETFMGHEIHLNRPDAGVHVVVRMSSGDFDRLVKMMHEARTPKVKRVRGK